MLSATTPGHLGRRRVVGIIGRPDVRGDIAEAIPDHNEGDTVTIYRDGTTPAHVCNMRSAWPIGHPLPPEDPAMLTGPEVGAVMRYVGKYPKLVPDDGLVTVKARSYVWSPGECRANGGYRHYNWTVITWMTNPSGAQGMVVNDTDLAPAP